MFFCEQGYHVQPAGGVHIVVTKVSHQVHRLILQIVCIGTLRLDANFNLHRDDSITLVSYSVSSNRIDRCKYKVGGPG